MSQSTLPPVATSRPGRRLTVAAYVVTALSFAAPVVLGAVAIALGLAGESRGDRGGRTAAVVAGVVLVLQMTFGLLWVFGVIQLPK